MRFPNQTQPDSISKLIDVIDSIGGDSMNAYPVIKRLAVLAPPMPHECIECLRSLFGRKVDRLYLATMGETETIIRAALASADQMAISTAHQVINDLSERGDTRYRNLIA